MKIFRCSKCPNPDRGTKLISATPSRNAAMFSVERLVEGRLEYLMSLNGPDSCHTTSSIGFVRSNYLVIFTHQEDWTLQSQCDSEVFGISQQYCLFNWETWSLKKFLGQIRMFFIIFCTLMQRKISIISVQYFFFLSVLWKFYRGSPNDKSVNILLSDNALVFVFSDVGSFFELF